MDNAAVVDEHRLSGPAAAAIEHLPRAVPAVDVRAAWERERDELAAQERERGPETAFDRAIREQDAERNCKLFRDDMA